MSQHNDRKDVRDDSNLRWVDAIADRFDAAWQAALHGAPPPRIEDYLGETDEARRPALLRELVQLDAEYRHGRGRGQLPTASDYASRFPSLDAEWLQRVIAAVLAASQPLSPPGERGRGEGVDAEQASKPSGAPLQAQAKRIRCPHCQSPIQLIDDRPDDVLCPSCGSSFRLRDTRMTSTVAHMRQLGKFQLLERLGLGAFGAVWKARDTVLDKIVALKIPHAGLMQSDDERNRFFREARAAAQLRHPGIVTVHEVAELETDSGKLPALVSDFVEGVTLRDLLGTRRLTFREAAELIAQLAEALDYAHSLRVVHRDMKPANVIIEFPVGLGLGAPLDEDSRVQGSGFRVQEEGGRGQESGVSGQKSEVSDQPRSDHSPLTTHHSPRSSRPRPLILDFGLALRDEAEATMTVDGQILGTPAYMSPEQATGHSHQVDGTSDVYSLGVMLYELTTGELPFRGSRAALVRQIVYDEPPPPRRVNDKLPRDLETITLKCLAKSPARRYATARALSDDLRRWLRGEPILARPVGAIEKLWLWSRRNPRGAGLAGAVAMLLVAVAVVSSIMAFRESRHRQFAEQAARTERDLRTAADQANTQLAQANTDLEAANASERAAKQDADQKRIDAETARDETKQVLDYLVASFRKPDPEADGEKLTVVELFDQAAEQMDTTFANQPLIQAELLTAIGQTYLGLGLYQKAVAVLERARNLYQNELGEHHANLLSSMNNLAAAYKSVGRLKEAVRLSEHTLELTKAKLGLEHPHTLTSMNNLASAYSYVGRLEEAVRLFEHTLELRKAKLGPQHSDTLTSMNNLAGAYKSAGRLSEAVPLLEQTLQLKNATVGPDHPDTLTFMGNLAVAYESAGRIAEALPLFEQTLQMRKAKLGPDHPDTLKSMSNLANAYRSARRLAEALPLNEQTLQLMRAKLGPQHPDTLTSMNNLAATYLSAGKMAEALPLLEQMLEQMKVNLGPEHPLTLTSMNNLAMAYKGADKLAEAVPLFEQTLELRKANLGPGHPNTLTSMNNLAMAYQAAEKLTNAMPLLEETLELRRTKLGPEHPETLMSISNLAKAYLMAEQPDKALPLFDQFFAAQRQRAARDDATFARHLATVSLELLQHRQYPVAETYLRECLMIREKKLPDDWVLFNTKSLLGGALAGQKKFPEAEPLLVEGYSGMKEREAKIPANAKVRLTEALQRLIDLYTAWAKPDEAAKWQKVLDESAATSQPKGED